MYRQSLTKDFTEIITKPDMWLFMAWMDIKLRYQRTKIGPFWMVIVSFISIICIAALGTLLFKVKFGDFFPYVTCGMVVWSYMSVMITESCTVFISQIGLIKHTNAPLISFSLRMFCRNTIVFLHSLVIAAIILIYYQIPLTLGTLMIIPGFMIFGLTATALSLVLGIICTRFRDILQLIQALIGILAFLTPIMWKADMLGEHAYLVNFNPLTHYVALIREPLLGHAPSIINITAAILFTSLLIILANMLYNKFKKRLVYWL